MSLILDKKYKTKKANFLFWSNRGLRIFPIYWITLVVLLILILLKFYFRIGSEDNAIIHYLINTSGTSPGVFYSNLINFISRNLTLIISVDYWRVNNSVPGYLLIPQAWTLQIELLFYLVAPFIARFSKKIFIYFSVIYVLLFFGFVVPGNFMTQNLTYQFLNDLIYFLLGMATYKFIYKSIGPKSIPPKFLSILLILFISYLLLYNYLPFKIPLMSLNLDDAIYFLVLTSATPFIFLYTRLNKFDNFLGKLSYPVYITHLLVIKFLSNTKMFLDSSFFKTILVVFVTLFISYLLVKFIDTPIDLYRQRRLKI